MEGITENLNNMSANFTEYKSIKNSEAEDVRLFNDYLSTNSVYPDPIFEDGFECEESVYIRIVNAFESCSSYF